jgi:hypothetical protein
MMPSTTVGRRHALPPAWNWQNHVNALELATPALPRVLTVHEGSGGRAGFTVGCNDVNKKMDSLTQARSSVIVRISSWTSGTVVEHADVVARLKRLPAAQGAR